MKDQSIPNESEPIESKSGNPGWGYLILDFMNQPEVSKWSRLIRRIYSVNKIWDDIFQTIVTICIAVGVVLVLIYVQGMGLIDKSTFGVMFGTVIGYVLSWRFGK